MRLDLLRRTCAVGMLLSALLTLLWCVPAGADVPPGAQWSEAYFTSGDGTRLHADVLRPEGVPADRRTPVVLVLTPYANHSGPGVAGSFPSPGFDPTRSGPQLDQVRWLWEQGRIFARGYTLVAVDLRGFGASEGCWDFAGPGEQADARAAVDWAASAPWSNGRVGMVGHSYPAIAAIMALSQRPSGLEAVAISAGTPTIDLVMASNGVHYGPLMYLAAPAYTIDNFPPGTLDDNFAYHAAWAAGVQPSCATNTVWVDTAGSDRSSPFYRARDVRERLAGVRVPVLYGHGFADTRVRPHVWASWIPRLGGERRMWIGQWAHSSPLQPASGGAGWADEVFALFADELWGDGRRRISGARVQEGPSGRFREERAWPPADGERFRLGLLDGTYLDMPGNTGEVLPLLESPGSQVTPQLGLTGQGAWTFSAPLTGDHHLAGVARLELAGNAPPGAVVVALLYDVAPDGTALLVTRGATRWTAGRARFDLFPQDWRFASGHRLGLLLTGADGDYWSALEHSLQQVAVTGGALTLPFLGRPRTAFLAGVKPPALLAKQPIRIDAATVRTRTARTALEPPPALRVSTTPRHVPRGRWRSVRIRVAVESQGQRIPIEAATVRIGRRRATTGRDGRARLRIRIYRSAKVRASAIDWRPGTGRIAVRTRLR